MISVVPYTSDRANAWNAFVARSKNGLFMFDRSYMDYHRDRFDDASLLVYRDDALVAVLPANRHGQTVQSHGGLTFGGLITDQHVSMPRFLEAFAAVLAYLQETRAELFEYRAPPTIYHQLPAEEDRYALFLSGAECCRRDVTSVILPGRRLPLRKGRASEVSKAKRHALRFEESNRWADFWEILSDNLHRKHGRQPVHSIAEIEMLHSRFPQNIRLFTVASGAELHAGTVIYESVPVAHTQYIGCSQTGYEIGAVDFLIVNLLDHVYAGKPYFDFGISNENDGLFLNKGLIEFKEGFGARSITHDFYVVKLQEVDREALKAERRALRS
jgi:hypothetical protein